MKLRKSIPLIVAIVIIIILWIMYQNQHRLYLQTRQANYNLVTKMNELRQKDERIQQGMQQIQNTQALAPQLKGTFIDRKKYFRQNWQNYIHVSLNNYKTGFLGGMKDIKVTVNNDTEFPLDNVMVSLLYFRANGKLFKKGQLSIDNIQPKSSKEITAPDSRRGMKITVKFQRITSQEMNFCWSVDKKAMPGDNDPYQCVPAGK
jgi:hypothetical protein